MKNRFVVSLPALSGYLGTVLSVWAVIQDHLVVAVISFGSLSIVLGGYLIVIYRKYLTYKRFKKIDEEIHRLQHSVREYVTRLRMCSKATECELEFATATKAALTHSSRIFTVLTEEQCTSSLMLPIGKNGQGPSQPRQLKTMQYCLNVSPARESRPSRPLEAGRGIAAKAFSTGDVVAWTHTDRAFETCRDDYEAFYQSGICAPIRTGLNYVGLLNIDSQDADGFSAKMHKEHAAAIAATVGLIYEAAELWKDLRRDAK